MKIKLVSLSEDRAKSLKDEFGSEMELNDDSITITYESSIEILCLRMFAAGTLYGLAYSFNQSK